MAHASLLERLAIFGNEPLSPNVLHVGRPNVLDRALLFELLDGAIERGWLTNDGPLVRRFEQEFASFSGVRNAVAVANATLGLQIVAVALGLEGEIVMPAFTFIGTAHAFAWMGLTPVFADVLPDTHTIDPADAAKRISPRTSAIVGVHLWGGSCEVDALQDVADANGVALIYDAAHATGSTRAGRPIGGFGRAEVFSLHATKAVNALEAGMITTDDDELADRLRSLRNYAFIDEDEVGGLGINAKLNEFSAAMGIANLGQFERIRAHNEALHAAYAEGLADAPGIRMVRYGGAERHSHHYAVFELAEDVALTRDELRRILVAENIRARRYFMPGCHRSPPYSLRGIPSLPVTDRLSRSLIQLPTGLQLEPEMARRIGSLVASCLRDGESLHAALADGRVNA